MLVIPLYALLIIYFIYLLVFLLFSAINVYHIFASASYNFPSIVMTVTLGCFTIITLYLTVYLLIDVNWFSNITLFNFGNNLSIFIK